MKYSLRSLFWVVTAAAVFIGLWGENWRTCKAREREHAQQADQLDEKVLAEVKLAITSTAYLLGSVGHQRQAREHRSLAAEYRQAIWQPWKRWWIEELPPQDTKH